LVIAGLAAILIGILGGIGGAGFFVLIKLVGFGIVILVSGLRLVAAGRS
jgi:hypothetical protein